MRISSVLAAAAIALAAGIGAASAADQFAALDGIPAERMSATELATVQGEHVTVNIVGGDSFEIPSRGLSGTVEVDGTTLTANVTVGPHD